LNEKLTGIESTDLYISNLRAEIIKIDGSSIRWNNCDDKSLKAGSDFVVKSLLNTCNERLLTSETIALQNELVVGLNNGTGPRENQAKPTLTQGDGTVAISGTGASGLADNLDEENQRELGEKV
jgi:hypothetical protein